MNDHHHTPTLTVLDPRSLAIRGVGYCRHPDKSDIESRITRQVFDAVGRLIESWDPRLWETSPKPNLTTVYGLSGQPLQTDSVDAGWQLSLLDQAGSLCSFWDGRGNQRHIDYDDLQRPTTVTEQPAEALPRVVERLTYGDSDPAFAVYNQCGQLIRHDDPAGAQFVVDYGLTGSMLIESRCFLVDLEIPDWPSEPDARDALLENQSFVTCHAFTPTGEIRRLTDAMGNDRTFGYDVAGKLREVWLLLDGEANQPQRLVSDIQYNAYEQIESETAGNGVVTRADYSADDGRLIRLMAQAGDQKPLQDLNYCYDPVGNIVELEDKSQSVTYFDNQRIDPINHYRYDSLYQLVEAKGWEVATPGHGPALPELLPMPLDPNQRRQYTQRFDYDPAGNLITRHHSGAPGFSMFTSASSNRSLAQRDDDSLPGEPDIDSGFDAGGNQLELQRGQAMTWDIRNQLSRVTLVKREDEPDDYEWYAYDRPGHRLRKVHVSQTNRRPLRTEVRYLPSLEIHRQADGEEHHVISAEAGRCSVRALHWPEGAHADQLRYSLGDHLGSSTLELDANAGVLTQEHYYPFGGTACWAGKSALVAKYKTIKYSGKERDATGLYYYGYRYYAPWLQRWVSSDPVGTVDGLNLFLFVNNGAVSYKDRNGLTREDSASMMRSAKSASLGADRALINFRQESSAREKFKQLVNVVINRNKELKALGGFVFSADINTPHDKAFFWSGDGRDSNGRVVVSAMYTAQFIASRAQGKTVEMTPGGKQLDEYKNVNSLIVTQHSSGYMYLNERFQYVDSPMLRADFLANGALKVGAGVRTTIGKSFFSSDENPLNAQRSSVAAALWDVTSIRFARAATGEVNVVHASSVHDPYFSSQQYLSKTWFAKERVALQEEGKTTIVERFLEDLQIWERQKPR
ncbi:RHS repeat domain-containing protein [Pseudomonas sp. XS1P51]